VLAPVGRIELTTADALKVQLLAALAQAARGRVRWCQCAHLDYISSAGCAPSGSPEIGQRQRPRHRRDAAVVREIYAISRFDTISTAFDSVRDALAKLDPAALESPGGAG